MGIEPTNDGYEPPAITILAIRSLLLVPFLEMQRSGIENSNGFGYEAWRQKSYSTASRYILQDAAGYHHKGTFTLYRPA